MSASNLVVRKPIIGEIERRIYIIRGRRVMLDSDLAFLYGVETRVLNQAVRRNRDNFPEDFMFALTRQEIRNLSQTVIGSTIKHSPNIFAFTREGIAMLSSVLRSKRAVQVNISIMRAFVKMGDALAAQKDFRHELQQLRKTVTRKLRKHEKAIEVIFEAIQQMMNPPRTPVVGFVVEPGEQGGGVARHKKQADS